MKIYHYETLPSTNAEAKRMILDGARDGVLLAEHQTSGRGRLGRSFFSENGIFMSVILSPERISFDPGFLTSTMAAAACRAITEKGFPVGIKWVNDIYLDGKKVCGILTEGSILPGEKKLQYAVIGIGVNITPPKGGFPPEIAHIAGAILPSADDAERARSSLAAGILNRLMTLLDLDDRKACLDEYRRRSILQNREITVHRADGTTSPATALDVDDDYRLIVRYENGKEEHLDSGEVSIKL